MQDALKQRVFSLEERLKVASYIWRKEGSTKETVLTKWVCEEICSAYSKKARFSMRQDVCSMLWEFLCRVFGQKGSCYISAHLVQASAAAVRSAQSGADELCTAVVALRWLKLVLGVSPLPPALYKYDLLVTLVEASLKMCMTVLVGMHSSHVDVLPALTILLRHYAYVQGTQANPKKVFTSTCTQLLESMLLLRRLLCCNVTAGGSDWGQLKSAIDEVITLLFNKDHLPDLTSALGGSGFEESSDKRSATSYVKVLLQTLEHMVEAGGDSQEAVHDASPIVFKYFLDQNRKENTLPRLVEFQFLFRLSLLLGFSVDKDVVKGAGDKETSVDKEATKELLHGMITAGKGGAFGGSGLGALLQCLQLAQEYEVYQAVEDEGGQLPQLQALAKKILCLYSINGEAVVGCVRVLLKLKHKSVEPFLPAIWGVIFYQNSIQAQSEFSGFVEDCINAYAKLKQLRVLVEMQLMALRVLMDLGVAPPPAPTMTSSVEAIYRRRIHELPHGQCVELLEALVCAIQEDYIIKLNLTKRSKRRKTLSEKPGEEEAQMRNEGCVVACLLKLIDLFGVIMCSVPLDVWGGGLQKEKAKNVLDRVVGMLYPQLMEAACGVTSLLSPALYLSYFVCQITACLKVVHPSVVNAVWPLPLTWCEEHRALVPKVWASSPSFVIPADPLFSIIMKHIAVLCLKFGEENALQKELAALVFGGLGVPMATSMDWSGQLLDVTEDHLPAASLQLVLSQFPVLYHHCDATQMRHVADAILHSLLCERDCGGSGQPRPVLSFLLSPSYQDMSGLHEALIASVLSHSVSKAPMSFHEDIKHALRWSSDGVEEGESVSTCEEVFSHALMCTLEREGEEKSGVPVVKVGKRTMRYMKCFGAYVQVLSSIPLEALNVLTRLRLLVSCSCWHIAAVHLLLATSHIDEDTPISPVVYTLQTLLACTLTSLVKQRGKRRGGAMGLPENLLPADLLARWCYVATKGLVHKGKADKKVIASSLVAIEKAVHWSLVNSSSCEGILKEVATDLGEIPSNRNHIGETTLYAEQCVKVISSIMCKIYTELATSPHPTLTSCLELVVDMVTKGVAQVIGWPPTSRLKENCALLSAFMVLIGSCAQLLSPLSREHACILFKCVENVNIPFEASPEMSLSDELDKTLAILDILMMPAYTSGLTAQATPNLPEGAVLVTWSSLQSHLFNLLCCHGHKAALNAYKEMRSFKCGKEEVPDALGKVGDQSEAECLHAIYGRVLRSLMQLLGVATRDQTKSIFEHIFSESSTKCQISVRTFCLCWNVVLDSKLTEDSQKELRRWLCKVLLLCIAAVNISSTDEALVAIVTDLVGRLVSIPSQVGLDARSVVISLHVCSAMSAVSMKPSNDSVQVLNGICHLLSAVVRNHSLIAGACPAPVIVSVNKLIEAVISVAQDSGMQSDDANDAFLMRVTHCAAMVSRLLETVAKHTVLAKFVCYSVVAFTVSSRSHPLHQHVKQALLPGVCSMIGVCSDHDSAFIKTMLSQSDREGYKELVEEYKSYHRFSGRV